MDPQRFDALARRAGAVGARRRALLSLVGSTLATSMFGPAPAVAGCKKVGKKCDKTKDCCDDARCKGGKNGKCRCKSGFSECGGKCYDLDKDETHCGSCDTTCAAGESCVDGVCAEGGCTAGLDSCVEGALCIACPDRPGSVCYRDNSGTPRCSVVLLCVTCDDDADCAGLGPNARCITSCPGQCSGTACAAG